MIADKQSLLFYIYKLGEHIIFCEAKSEGVANRGIIFTVILTRKPRFYPHHSPQSGQCPQPASHIDVMLFYAKYAPQGCFIASLFVTAAETVSSIQLQ